MKLLARTLWLLLLLGACRSEELNEWSGTFLEAEMQTVTVAPERGAAVTFSTEQAELVGFDYLQPGAPVRVTFLGRIPKEGTVPALRIEVDTRYAQLCARWIESGEGAEAFGMGFELAPKGGAYPIGMQTVVFKRWQLMPDGGLLLAGHTLENGETVPFSEEWEIRSLGADELVLAQPDLVLRFRPENEEDVARRLEREAEAVSAPADKTPKTKK